jgi:hypothetical protein
VRINGGLWEYRYVLRQSSRYCRRRRSWAAMIRLHCERCSVTGALSVGHCNCTLLKVAHRNKVRIDSRI